jgi:hypothetical protein
MAIAIIKRLKQATTNATNKMTESFVESASFWFAILTLGLTVLTGFSGAVAWIFSNADAQKKEKRLKAYQAESGVKIAEAKTESEVARKDAAAAKERTLSLEGENLKLKLKMQPRIITNEQRKLFIESLQGAPRGIVLVYADSSVGGEAKNYAEMIRRIIRQAGFVGDGADRDMVELTYGSNLITPGVKIQIQSSTNAPRFTGSIQRAFEKIGIEAIAEFDGTLPENQVVIVVGTKF